MSTGRWKVPATRFDGPVETQLEVNDLANRITRAGGLRSIPQRAILAEMAATLNDPETGEPQSLASWAAKNSGIAAAGVTAVDYGDSHMKVTRLKIGSVLPAIAGGANLAVGKLLFTLPAGVCMINGAHMDVAITQTAGNINADTPDVGVGTVIGSGAVAVLGGTATFENIVTGQTAANCTGTKTDKTTIPTANVPLVIEAGSAHSIYLNVADGWAASGDPAAILTGDVWLYWTFLGL